MRVLAILVSAILVSLGVPVPATASEPTKAHPLTVWAVNHRGTLRCQATFEDRILEPGRPIEVHLSVTNLTGEPREVGSHGFLEIRAADGTELWTSDGVIGAFEPTRRVGPHRTVKIHPGTTTRVRWSGPLLITPICPETGRLRMPTVSFDVEVPEPPASTDEAIAAAVATPGSPWQACPPGPAGEATTGSFQTPDGFPLPPLSLRCWAEVRHEAGFDVVSLHAVSPSDAPDFAIPGSTSMEGAFFDGGELPGEDAMYAARWTFTVTAEGARPVLSQVRSRTVGEGEARPYLLSGGAWEPFGFSVPCGYSLFGVDSTGRAILVDWITACSGTGAGPSREVVIR